MGNQWIASRRPFLCIVLLAILNAGSVAWATQGPPVPGQAMVEIEEPLILIEAAMLVHGQLQILARPGSQLVIREPFILRNPARLVIDVSGAKLGNVGLPFPPASIGGVVVNTVRFGQMDAETVRIVVETDDPERLQVAVQENRLMVSASRGAGILANVSRYLFGRGPSQPESYGKPSIPPPLPTPSPAIVSSIPPSVSPGLTNLRKLQAQSGYRLDVPQRTNIINIARSQLGLSKDTDREYVNRTFSQGRDTDWCADFVSTILEWAGGSPWGHLSRVQDIYEWGLANHRLDREPQPADVVVFSYGGSGFDHVALVESVNPDNTLTTIGGNEGYAISSYKTSGSVTRSVYKLDDKRILGFVDPVVPKGLSANPAR
jgi:hypothetical protein